MEVGSVSDIKVRIYGEFNDKAFKRASKATSGLESSFKKLGGAVVAAFSVQKILAFSKASVKAFIEDDKAAKRLTQTFKNLGLAYDATTVNGFVDSLQRQTGVADTELRPALEILTRTTLDFSKAQSLLGTAMDISAGTGMDLTTVSNALSKAYLGNFTSLARLNIGISQSEAKTISFDDAIKKLNQRFTGQAKLAAESYAGKISRIKIAADEAQETIGKGLVTALEILSQDRSIDGLTSQMDRFAKSISEATVGLADLLKPITTKNPQTGTSVADDLFTSFFGLPRDAYQALVKRGQEVITAMTSAPSRGGAPGAQRLALENQKLLAKQVADQKKLAALQKKAQLDAAAKEKATQQLKRAGTVFDMENIQIVAALQGKVTEEQRLRLLALLAINNDMADAADKLTQAILAVQSPAFNMLGITITASDNATTVVEKLIKAQTQLLLVSGGIADIPKAKNPFEDWDKVMKSIIDNLDTISKKIKELPQVANQTVTTAKTITDTVIPNVVPDTVAKASAASVTAATYGIFAPTAQEFSSLGTDANLLATTRYAAMQQSIQGSNALANNLAAARYEAMYQAIKTQNQQTNDLAAARYAAMQQYYAPSTPTVVVNVAGNVTTERDLVTSITDSLYEFQRSGGDIRLSAVAI